MGKLKDNSINWLTRVLLRFWPAIEMSRLAAEVGLDSKLMNAAQDLFSKTKRIDIFPIRSDERGFQIVLDKNTALYFYQDGDHFVFDGSEVGEYEDGDVTIFDHLH